jgi:tetratricopeptide (TPR) repeat protein
MADRPGRSLEIRPWLAAAGLMFAASLCASNANADAATDSAGDCVHKTGEAGIEACNWVINSGKWAGPNLAWAYNDRGWDLTTLGQYGRAVADFDQAIELKPDYGHAFDNRCFARAAWNLGLQFALADCNKALELRPNNASALQSRGFVYFRLGDFASAISDESAAIAIKPANADALYVRGLAHLRSSNPSSGDADIAAAEKIDPAIATTYSGYGVTP